MLVLAEVKVRHRLIRLRRKVLLLHHKQLYFEFGHSKDELHSCALCHLLSVFFKLRVFQLWIVVQIEEVFYGFEALVVFFEDLDPLGVDLVLDLFLLKWIDDVLCPHEFRD